MPIEEFNLRDYHVKNETVFDNYFHLKDLSKALNGRRVTIITNSDLKSPQSPKFKDVILDILKVLSYCTLIIPLVMFIGRSIRNYQILNHFSKSISTQKTETVAKQTWKMEATQRKKQAGIVTDLLNKIRNGDLQGIDYEKREKEGITTWKIEYLGKAFEINEYARGAYHGPKTEGFLERQRLIVDAAKMYVRRLPENSEALLSRIDDLQKEFLQEMSQDKYQIDPQLMQDGDKNAANAHYNRIHDAVKELLAQLTKDIQYVISTTDPTFTMKSFEEVEKEFIIAEGRPTIINTYFIDDQQFFHMQEPASRQARPMLPSTVRNREGLVNYVKTSCGPINLEGDQLHASTTFEAIRHSSYPPITIQDPYQRQAIACRNFKELLVDLALKKADLRENELIQIPISAMMLLSPKKVDFVRNYTRGLTGKWKGKSEVMQVEESALALSIYNQRIIEVEIEGKKIRIQPQTSFMNFGANSLALGIGIGSIFSNSESLTSINSRGFVRFEEDFFSFMRKELNHYPALQTLLDAIDYIQRPFNSETQEELKKLYGQLDEQMELYLQNPRDADIQKTIDQLKADINKHEKQETSDYRKYVKDKLEVFENNREELHQVFQDFRKALLDQEPLEEAEKQKLQNIWKLVYKFEKASLLFLSKQYQSPHFLLDFQALYVDIQETIGKQVEFFCKSAEDRTGRLDDKIQENKIFESLFNRPPITVEDQEYIDRHISPWVHQYSVSQNNTERNSGARGFQLEHELHPHLLIAPEFRNAQLGRGVFARAKQLKPLS